MKFTIKQAELLEALEGANKAVSDSVIMPVLNTFLFKIDGLAADIIASNQELSISKRIDISGEDKIDVCIPAARLIGLIRALPDQPLIFIFDDKTVTINSSSGKYVMPTIVGEDFPIMSPEGANKSIIIDGKAFTSAINKTVFAACNDILKKTNGYCVDIAPEAVTFTGCNNTILSTQSVKSISELTQRIVLPFKSAVALNGINAEGEINLQIFDKNISIEFNNTAIRSVLLENIYPDWRAIIPTDNQIIVSVDKTQLAAAVKRTTQFSDAKTGVIKISLTAGKFLVEGQDVKMGENAVETLVTDYTGEEVSIGSNGEMLAQCINASVGDQIEFYINDFKTMVVMRSEAEKDNFMLLMPFVI